MAPGVVQNADAIISDSLEKIATVHNGDLINELTEGLPLKTCPIEHFSNGSVENGVDKVEDVVVKKPVRKVVRPKVLKNHESREYLYDRLYGSTCPMAVSCFFLHFYDI